MQDVEHVTIAIARPPDVVAAFLLDAANLPAWADGLGSVEQRDGRWVVVGPSGTAGLRFVAANDHGVVDHWVCPEGGDEVHVPVRVLANDDGAQVTFTVFGRPNAGPGDLAQDRNAVAADLERLQRTLERG